MILRSFLDKCKAVLNCNLITGRVSNLSISFTVGCYTIASDTIFNTIITFTIYPAE